MLYNMSGIIILALFVNLFTGCDDEYRSKDIDMEIEGASILSISNDRPAEVVIGAFGIHHNGCVNTDGDVYAERYDNRIYIKGMMKIFVGGTCFDAETAAYGEVTVKHLEVGDYKIMFGNKFKPQRLRIEPDAAYVSIEPVISFSIVSDDSELEDTSYHVIMSMSGIRFHGFHDLNCEPILKTDIELIEDVINVDMWHVVPNTDSDCDIMAFPGDVRQEVLIMPYNEIELGTFSAGSYKVVINGLSDYLIEVPPRYN